MAADHPTGDIALQMMQAALAQLDLEGRRAPAAALQSAIDILLEEVETAAGAQPPHRQLQ